MNGQPDSTNHHDQWLILLLNSKARHWNPCKHPNCADWAIIDGYCSLAHLRYEPITPTARALLNVTLCREATEYRPCKTCKKNRRAMGRDYCSRTCDDFATGRTMARLDEIEFKDFRTGANLFCP
jgi:hypothetical protein